MMSNEQGGIRLFDEILLYGGITLSGLSALCIAAVFLVDKIRTLQLSSILDDEYGKETKGQ